MGREIYLELWELPVKLLKYLLRSNPLDTVIPILISLMA